MKGGVSRGNHDVRVNVSGLEIGNPSSSSGLGVGLELRRGC